MVGLAVAFEDLLGREGAFGAPNPLGWGRGRWVEKSMEAIRIVVGGVNGAIERVRRTGEDRDRDRARDRARARNRRKGEISGGLRPRVQDRLEFGFGLETGVRLSFQGLDGDLERNLEQEYSCDLEEQEEFGFGFGFGTGVRLSFQSLDRSSSVTWEESRQEFVCILEQEFVCDLESTGGVWIWIWTWNKSTPVTWRSQEESVCDLGGVGFMPERNHEKSLLLGGGRRQETGAGMEKGIEPKSHWSHWR
jgi:hypothetical protein